MVARPRLFETRGLHHPKQRCIALDSLGEGGWLKVMRLKEFTFWIPRWPRAHQDASCAIQDHAEDPSLPMLVFLVSTTSHVKGGTA